MTINELKEAAGLNQPPPPRPVVGGFPRMPALTPWPDPQARAEYDPRPIVERVNRYYEQQAELAARGYGAWGLQRVERKGQ
jgi:hypothetical protein